MTMIRCLKPRLLVALLLLGAAYAPPTLRAQGAGRPFDVVLASGRVIDPASGLDAVRHIGIRDGRIAAISASPLKGKAVLDATGLVVAPGFIDMHSHATELPAQRMQAFDGVTTALELEAGTLPVAAAYDRAAREGRALNYGFAASWVFARIAETIGMEPTGDLSFFQQAQRRTGWQYSVASPEMTARIVARVERGLAEGGLGVGILAGYAPGYGRQEAFAIARLAATHGVPTYTHTRSNSMTEPLSAFEAMEEIVALAAASGAHMHVVHMNSSSGRDVPRIAELIAGAQARGLRITTEAYPYGAGSTVVGAEIFRGEWRARTGMTAADIEKGGVPYTDSTLAEAQAREPGTWIVSHFLRPERSPADQALLDRSVLFPGGAIASDAMPWTANGELVQGDVWPLPANAFAHPRGAGTFTRFLRSYVRERKATTLRDALARMTIVPARILESSVPAMRRKGRLQLGADADLVAFDLGTVSDQATYAAPNAAARGMRHVLVGGVPLIRDGSLDTAVRPGRPIRRPVTAGAATSGGPDRLR